MQINHRLIFYFLIIMVTIPGLSSAQQLRNDTASYTSQAYVVEKRKEKVSDIAQKLKVDAALISAMNDSLSVDSVLTKGQTIRVPVSLQQVTKPSGNGNAKDEPRARKGKKNAANKNADDKQGAVSQPEPKPNVVPIDTELIQNRILLTDATLELNKALLQGIQASLDTLNANDKTVADEKNIQATIHSMQRRRDKTLLTPFLLHMQDSLKTEIGKEENEKTSLQNTLGLNKPGTLRHDTVVAIAHTTKYHSAVAVNNQNKDTVGKVTTVEAGTNTADDKQLKKPIKSAKNGKGKTKLVVDNTSARRDSVANNLATTHHWETAKALYYNDEATSTPAEPSTNDSTFADLQMDDSQDTSAYVPNLNTTTDAQPAMSDSARQIKAQVFVTRAMKASNEKNYKSAAQNLKKAIDLLPNYYDAWFALGEADSHLGLLTKALNEFKTCTSIDSSKAVLYYKMGNIQLKLKQRPEAAASFNRSLRLDSNYIPSIMGNASLNMDKKRYKAAIKEYTRVLEIDWGYHTAYRSRAMAEYWLKNYDAAIDDFTRYIIFDETDASVYYYRGLAKINIDEPGDACADFSISVKLGYAAALKASDTNCK